MLIKRLGEKIKQLASDSVSWLRAEEELTDQIAVEIESTLVQFAKGNPSRSYSATVDKL